MSSELQPAAPATSTRALARARTTVVGLALLGLALTFLNRDLPILRNALVYARVADNLREHPVGEVVRDDDLGYQKPILFPLLARPLTAALGGNLGMMATSCLTGFVFLAAAWVFFRHFNRRLGISDDYLWLELALLFFNPLVMYQFWSGYPDALVAATFTLALPLLDRVLRDERASPMLWPAVYGLMYVTLIAKLYGGILLGLQGLYLLVHWGQFRRNVLGRRRHLLAWGLSTLGVLVLLAGAFLGWNPTLYMSPDSGALMHYVGGLHELAEAFGLSEGAGEAPSPAIEEAVAGGDDRERYRTAFNLAQMVAFLLFTFGLASVFALSRNNLSREALGLHAVAVPFCVGLVAYKYTWFNMRLFLPIAPIGALLIVNGYRHLRWRQIRAGWLALSIALAAVGVFNFNTRTGQAVFAGFNARLTPYIRAPWRFPWINVDCLRMYRHVLRRTEMDHVNQTLPAGARLYIVHKYYYGAARGFYVREGFYRDDLELVEVTRVSEVPWTAPRCAGPRHLCYFYRLAKNRPARPEPRPPSRSRPWAEDLGWGLARIVPQRTADE